MSSGAFGPWLRAMGTSSGCSWTWALCGGWLTTQVGFSLSLFIVGVFNLLRRSLLLLGAGDGRQKWLQLDLVIVRGAA